jgi:hypothetical protein
METQRIDGLEVDLRGIELEEVEVFAQPGGRGMADFAGSCTYTTDPPSQSCAVDIEALKPKPEVEDNIEEEQVPLPY